MIWTRMTRTAAQVHGRNLPAPNLPMGLLLQTVWGSSDHKKNSSRRILQEEGVVKLLYQALQKEGLTLTIKMPGAIEERPESPQGGAAQGQWQQQLRARYSYRLWS